ncbi:2-succinyl-5-enolpyruvyl-6-hydroxy-3-cyclohexene-1-carboxylic-acid synthase [Runella sp. SP2]|uniref:2-succinyl-5-enolpyruvyl-6-hydroxy-3- cyclohexene-1-carboxylic-acid synthase n=1 Tax=Runella sp. SP2 TaxID=2268026 RepID=UPI000F07E1BF|nr:2-succinyl-5-enolpyruvyl-6-hydroxy-3-cyclohexene-1-carboxylic-acid synthase [Runella sp. SP2]AYQ35951.1 2-succinyl-5-enolpyruvyl-6-hydroxy-3-cyclohexene-1-carboxylic-acid synthase [Runella sp. SP2]
MILQSINNIAELCARKGVQNVLISPGSRSAALTLAFARHRGIKTKVIPDERVAGFVGMGMAQYSGQTVALVCTSGSAAYNLAPAVVEAFFQEIPLLVLTADRPKEWIHQQDGQTIYQNELYGKHVKKSFELPADYTHPDTNWYIERVFNEAINLSQTYPKGPVHVNVPIREPFYPTADEKITYDRNVRVVERLATQPTLSPETWHRLQEEFENTSRVLIAVGQLPPQSALWKVLKEFSEEMGVPVLGDIISNIPADDTFVRHHDVCLRPKNHEQLADLQPDLLITVGDSFISKNLKLFLRKFTPARHWHIKPTEQLIDTFQTLSLQVPVEPVYFFQKLLEDIDYQQFVNQDDDSEERTQYREKWLQADRNAQRKLAQFFRQETRWNEFTLVDSLMRSLPENSVLHLANSMPVRYANFVGVSTQVEVFANRGTSGIDGCTSTAVGSAMMTDKLVFLLTGDVSFFYDRNALWHPHLPANLRIVLFNNNGGNIFRLIDGPSAQPELEQYFETRHYTSARNSAEDAGMTYFALDNNKNNSQDMMAAVLTGTVQEHTFESIWKQFLVQNGKAKLLEIFTDPVINGNVFEAYRKMG